jgi:hypothetical protein
MNYCLLQLLLLKEMETDYLAAKLTTELYLKFYYRLNPGKNGSF